jgi:hypothetical protein
VSLENTKILCSGSVQALCILWENAVAVSSGKMLVSTEKFVIVLETICMCYVVLMKSAI